MVSVLELRALLLGRGRAAPLAVPLSAGRAWSRGCVLECQGANINLGTWGRPLWAVVALAVCLARLAPGWRACLGCRDCSCLLAKDPFPLCVPLLVLLGFDDCINPFLKDLQSSCARCGKPGSCSGQSCWSGLSPPVSTNSTRPCPGFGCFRSLVERQEPTAVASLWSPGPVEFQRLQGNSGSFEATRQAGEFRWWPRLAGISVTRLYLLLTSDTASWGMGLEPPPGLKSSNGVRKGSCAGAAEELLVLSHRCCCLLPRPALLVHPLRLDEGSKGHCCAGQTRSN